MSPVRFPIFIICAGLLARILFLMYLLIEGPYSFLAGTDSLTFYIEAVHAATTGQFLSWEIGWHSYVNVIASTMQVFGTSIFWMCSVSIAAWLLTALMVLQIATFCGASERMKVLVAAVIAFAPSLLLTSFIPLREPFQLLGITLIVYAIFLFRQRRRAAAIMLALLGAFTAGSLHLAMLASVIVLFFTPFLYDGIMKSQSITIGRILFVFVIAIIGYFVLLSLLESRNYAGSDSIFDAAESFQRTGATLDARAQYKSDIGYSSGFAVIYSPIIGFFQYLLEPMPWRIATLFDVIVFLENISRAALVVFAVLYTLRGIGAHRMSALFFVGLYLFAEFIWSLGTINWGTAARHHVPATALLLTASCAASAGYKLGHLSRSRPPSKRLHLYQNK